MGGDRRRRPKRPRSQVDFGEDTDDSGDESSSDDDDDNGEESEWDWNDQRNNGDCSTTTSSGAERRNRKKERPPPDNRSYKNPKPLVFDDEEIISSLGFCCADCKCPPERTEPYRGNEYIESDMVWHRRCCHGVKVATHDWAPPCDLAKAPVYHDQVFERSELVYPDVKKRKLKKFYETAKNKESQLYNEDGDLDHVSMANTNDQYLKNRKWFQTLPSRATKECVVLDLFAGVGTGIVVLKKLGIAIKKVIYCDKDKIAAHVYKSNHDPAYNTDLPPDDIRHVYIPTFEVLERKLESILKKHGPIDLVLGGPPCSDYSGANASRQGVCGVQGGYMPSLGELVKKMRTLQPGYPLLFLAENVQIQDKEDLDVIQQAFGIQWEPVLFDAKHVSPCYRQRHFFTNISLEVDVDYRKTFAPETCLDDDFALAANLCEKGLGAQALTFMASLSRIDDERMLVFRKQQGSKRYEGRYMKAQERERMMGYPGGYISQPVHFLFEQIRDKGFFVMGGSNWQKEMPEKFKVFAGNYHGLKSGENYKFDTKGFPVLLKMAHPPTGENGHTSFYDAEGYAKRLVGNAYSVPVVEALLKPIQRLFGKRRYLNYVYNYSWEDENCKLGVPRADSATFRAPSHSIEQARDNGSIHAVDNSSVGGGIKNMASTAAARPAVTLQVSHFDSNMSAKDIKDEFVRNGYGAVGACEMGCDGNCYVTMHRNAKHAQWALNDKWVRGTRWKVQLKQTAPQKRLRCIDV